MKLRYWLLKYKCKKWGILQLVDENHHLQDAPFLFGFY